MNLRRTLRSIGAAGAALALLAGGATAASAQPVPPSAPDGVEVQGTTASIRTDRGGTYFYHHSEELVVSDYLKDGYGVRAYLIWGDNRVSVYAAGVNTTDRRQLNLREGTTYWLQLCYTDNGQNIKCSKTVRGTA